MALDSRHGLGLRDLTNYVAHSHTPSLTVYASASPLPDAPATLVIGRLVRPASAGTVGVAYGQGTSDGLEQLRGLVFPPTDWPPVSCSRSRRSRRASHRRRRPFPWQTVEGGLHAIEKQLDVGSLLIRGTTTIQIALELDSMGKTDEAMRHLNEIVAARPHDVEALSSLAELQRSAKKYVEAAATYDKAIAAVGIPQGDNWTLFYFRGICYERAKQWPKAEADFKKALELNPDQPLVLNYLGYSWVDQGLNLDEAFKMLRKAVELRPNDGYIVDSLGWAHFKLGQYAEAAETLEKAIDLKPADPVLNDHLGDGRRTARRRLSRT